jgi:hypothetical protein
MTKIGALVIHGMGSQESNFADGLIYELSNRLEADAERIEWQPVHWAPFLRDRQVRLMAKMGRAKQPDGTRIDLDANFLRDFVLHKLGDAVAYQRDLHPESAGFVVHGIISDNIQLLKQKLNDPAAPIVVFAHSLGGHMMSNYIWDRQQDVRRGRAMTFEPLPTFLAFISFGCNIPLFGLAFDEAKPIDLPGEAITSPELLNAARWLNFVDGDDVLGWPLRPLYSKDIETLAASQLSTLGRIEDRQINVGNLLTSWNPFSHDAYWTDNDFTVPVSAYLKRVLALL